MRFYLIVFLKIFSTILSFPALPKMTKPLTYLHPKSLVTKGGLRNVLSPYRHVSMMDSQPFLPRKLEYSVYADMFISKKILNPSSFILLSVSGGCDSMAMWHIFEKIKKKYCPLLSLEVVHFNHKQRTESEEEVSIALEYCVDLN